MKKSIYSLFVIASLLLIAPEISAYGQPARLIRANIPFNFVVQDKSLPAGEYTIERIQVAASEALKIQSRDGRLTFIVPVRSSRAAQNQDEVRLVFNQLGGQYFLRGATGFEAETSYALLRSRTEDALAKSMKTSNRITVSVPAHRQ